MTAYRSHQVFSKFANQMFKYVLMVGYTLGSVNLISLGFVLIRFSGKMPFVLVMFEFIVLIFVAVFIVYLEHLTRKITTLSTQWYTSYLENNFPETKLDRLFWISCQPITIQVGDICTISTGEFILKMLGNVVLDNLVTFFLTLR